MHWVLFCPTLLVSLPVLPVALSKAVNRSIDDTLGDSVTGQRPLFLPSTAGVWEDATCKECSLRPPIQDAYDQTYTAATYESGMGNISISFPFTGTAIYVFFILANSNSSIGPVTTAANFTLDAVFQGTYTHPPDPNSPAFQFNKSALAFSKIGLVNRTHNLLISTSGIGPIFVNFDYALYTFEEEDHDTPGSNTTTLTSLSSSTKTSSPTGSPASVNVDTSKHSTSTGAIVGGTVGSLVSLCTLTAVTLICYRQRRRRLHKARGIIESGSTCAPFGDRSTPHYSGNTLLSERRISSLTVSSDPKAELSQIRHLELQHQMRAIQEEIKELQSEVKGRHGAL
ncbi:hypothetical protein D9757_005053 [Collybiopsis confluens]|uniref:Uncharacterized protein n=1 Tax=Collybiopsis confluens TaxID=2823264 RepID=A0A8H5HT63_9AGAR|nr:hypothetical protein D9757_005053 [Collybiopsis confluens]